MPNPQFIEQKPLTLGEVKSAIEQAEKRDKELGFLSNKTKEYLDNFTVLNASKKEAFTKKLVDLNVTRLREEHIAKIIDFLPKTGNELKVLLQGYNLSLSKKDQDSIIEVVAGFAKE